MAKTDCIHFNGYKPCGLNNLCEDACVHYQAAGVRILVLHLGALGAVLRATCILKPLKRAYPQSQIFWLTDAPADKLLANNPLIDKVFTTSGDDVLRLASMEFDLGFAIDKAQKAAGLQRQLRVEEWRGFSAGAFGEILPANQEARELWELGLSDHKKFFVNTKPETQLLTEALGLEYQRDPYILALSPEELDLAFRRRSVWSQGGKKPVVGINTGCAAVLPYKKLTIEKHIELVRALHANFSVEVVLLGGPEDTYRNQAIAEQCQALPSPTRKGIRDGLASVAAVDLVITGDSLGMHMAIALRKACVAWFGSTCAHEIDLYDRGEKVLAKIDCGPCWKRSCDREIMCYDQVSIKSLLQAVFNHIPAQSSKTTYDWHLGVDFR